MPGRSKMLVLGAALLLVAIGAGVALASGAGTEQTRATSTGEADHVVSQNSKSNQVEDLAEPEDSEAVEAEDDEAREASHPGDSAEDEAEGLDRPITGPDLDRASQAALDYLGGGRVTATEIGDEESYYEIEVTLDDGTQVDVQLDEEFDVVGTD